MRRLGRSASNAFIPITVSAGLDWAGHRCRCRDCTLHGALSLASAFPGPAQARLPLSRSIRLERCGSSCDSACRWKIVPRVALLALTVLAVMANISQRSSADGIAGSRATIALSGILFVGVLLLLVALPAAFFRAKIQEAKERHKSRKVRMQRRRNRTIVCRNSERSSSPTAACA